MRKGKSIIGLAVVGQGDGSRLGKVRDLIFDHETNELLALVVAEKDLFGLIDAHVVPWNQVRSIGADVVFVANQQSVINARDDARIHGVIDRQTCLSGTRIYTTDGRQLGTLADMCIDEQTGRVVGYEVSEGFVSDTLHGKKFLAEPSGISIGKDAAVVPAPAATELQQKQ